MRTYNTRKMKLGRRRWPEDSVDDVPDVKQEMAVVSEYDLNGNSATGCYVTCSKQR